MEKIWSFLKGLWSITSLKVVITASAILCIVARLIWPSVKIDSITLGLIVVAVLPWISGLIESVEFPGGWKIRTRDVQVAGDQITGEGLLPTDQAMPQPSFLAISDRDPNLALAGLRIEIERRLRVLADGFDLPENRPLGHTLRELEVRNVITNNVFGGLSDLIRVGNSAAHGARVERDVADWAMDTGPAILAHLDRIIEDTEPQKSS